MAGFVLDWVGSMAIVFLAVFAYVLLSVFHKGNHKALDQAGLILSVVIFLAAGLPVIGVFFYGDVFSGAQEAFLISVAITIGAFVAAVDKFLEVITEK